MLPKREWLEESSAYYEAIDMSQLNGRHKWTNRAVVSKPDELSRRFHMCSQRKIQTMKNYSTKTKNT